MNDIIGRELGQYRVIEQIGQGGMARVYKAFQPSLERDVAIKALPTHVENPREENFLRLFTNEARVVARLSHPHIIPIHDFGQADGWAYIVMEYVTGGTVRDRLAQAAAQGVQLSLEWALLMGEQAAQALDCAHRNGIVHRDVKPGNMLLRSDNHLLLSDFGIATILAAHREMTEANGEGTIGTPQYMAPEQGSKGGEVDHRTDIYALGVVLYQCVTGKLPFSGETPVNIILQHMNKPPERPRTLVPDLPPAVEHIILRAMAKNPDHRYQSAEDLAADLYGAREMVRGARLGGLNGGRQGGRKTEPILPRDPTGGYPTSPRLQAAYPISYTEIQYTPGEPDAPGTCFRCGAGNNPNHHYCTSCGYDLSGRRAKNDRCPAPSGLPLHCVLTFRGGPLSGRWFRLHQDKTTVGRAGGNDIVIPDGTVSRNHAALTFQQGAWFLEDVGSSNGTFINDIQVRCRTQLKPGDRLRFGDEAVEFDLTS